MELRLALVISVALNQSLKLDVVIGLERDQQGENRNITTVRILKNRFSGITGECCQLKYEEQTGRLTEVTTEAFQDGDIY